MHRGFERWLRLLLAVLLAAAFSIPQAAQAQTPTGQVLVAADDAEGLAWLAGSGAQQLVDYGAFSLWRLPGANLRALSARPAGLQSTSSQVLLRGHTIATTQAQAEPALPEMLRAPAASGEQLWLVQFAGPTLDAWLDALAAAGLEVVAAIPENAFLIWGNDPQGSLAGIPGLAGLVQWQGAYHPAYRMHPALNTPAMEKTGGEQDVTVQVYVTAQVEQSLVELAALATAQLAPPQPVLNLVNLRLRVLDENLAAIAARADVVNVEPYVAPQMLDEIQGQVLAGNTSTAGGKTTAAAPEYLDWLASKGFPQDPNAYPIVDVIDDGVDTGNAGNVQHPDFFTLGVKPGADRIAYLANCTTDPSADGGGGHGNLNAGVLGGYNNLSGFPYENAAGYQYGLGISPFGRVAGTKIFRNAGLYDLSQCGSSDMTLIRGVYDRGARLTSDSWGAPASGAYTAFAQVYDVLARDASTAAGNQQMLHVFAAGNDGLSGSPTVNSPGSAKNVLTVGATENPRDQGISCNGWTDADNADDMAAYSSRGTADGRAKPDVVAPGTHVQGPATQDPDYSAAFVCARYYPSGQTLYTWSTGTSHSTPAVAGAAQLAYEYYGRVLSPGRIPSPAMLKALLVNSPRYLTGLAANDTLPGLAQGWGMLDMGRLFDGTPRVLVDQTWPMASPGKVFSFDGLVSNPAQPLRVSLVWTDAPGSPVAGKALVNDLNLEVTVGGVTYRGNQFAGPLSVSGGTSDTLNNVENVFLPAGLSGSLQVRVTTAALNGDGLPGNADLTDQDFALVVYNALGDLPVSLSAADMRWYPVAGNHNTFPEPGDTLDLEVDLNNAPDSGLAVNISATLTVTQGLANVVQGSSAYPNLAQGATGANLTRFRVAVSPAQACGDALGLRLTVMYGGGSAVLDLPLIHTSLGLSRLSFTYPGLPVPIPDSTASNPQPATAAFSVSEGMLIRDLDVSVDISHTFIGDLELRLIGPGEQEVLLANRRGLSTDHYPGVTFDDEADRLISASLPPFSGSYRPEGALSAFDGTDAAGVWTLKVSDLVFRDTGQINGFTVHAGYAVCTAAELFFPLISR